MASRKASRRTDLGDADARVRALPEKLDARCQDALRRVRCSSHGCSYTTGRLYLHRLVVDRSSSPGIIETPLHAPEAFDTHAALHPVGRMGEIDDIVRGVLYLEQVPFVTGEFLHVDGGQSAGN